MSQELSQVGGKIDPIIALPGADGEAGQRGELYWHRKPPSMGIICPVR